jgi:xylulose-5-phosphate/fructose-6-phosphate phosphoketolase
LGEPTRVLGHMLADVMKLNLDSKNFRIVGPDETASNRLDGVFDVTNRMFMGEILPTDQHLSQDGRVLEV